MYLCELQVKHIPAPVRSLAEFHSGDLPNGLWTGIGYGSLAHTPLMSSRKPDVPIQEGFC